jgi:hypothetical protein
MRWCADEALRTLRFLQQSASEPASANCPFFARHPARTSCYELLQSGIFCNALFSSYEQK